MNDINEYAPSFIEPSYVIEVDEGRLYQEIIRVEATDKDCTPLFGDVCKYDILTMDQPFAINNEGSIRNTEPLNHNKSHNHILQVIAYDCAMKPSAPVMVNIKVRRICEAKISGVPERIDYTENSHDSVVLFPNVRIELCDLKCDAGTTIQGTATLKTKHIVCDRDTKCTDKPMIDLLPKGEEWTEHLINRSADVAHFQGYSGAIVPKSLLNVEDFAQHSFSLETIFRHRAITTNDKHTKEHIVCSADDHIMNRHHMALFIRNCKLILLLRKSYSPDESNTYSPAEWRWAIPQVCDNRWHHYTVNVRLPSIDLYIDGVKFTTNNSGVELADVRTDFPMHTEQGIRTLFTVGACYQGSESRLEHGFRGEISSIRIFMDETLSDDEVRCRTDCAERLILPDKELLELGEEERINAQMNEISVSGADRDNVEKLLQNIQYINSKENPTLGRRNIQLGVTMSCANETLIRLPTIDTYVMVTKPSFYPPHREHKKEEPQDLETPTDNRNFAIKGAQSLLVSYYDIKTGVKFLKGLNIQSKFYQEAQIDSCIVTVYPSLNSRHEEITMELADSPLKTNISKAGVELLGTEAIEHYTKSLRSLIYTNRKPKKDTNKMFKVVCEQMDDDSIQHSEFTVTLTLLNPKKSQIGSVSPVVAEEPKNHPEIIVNGNQNTLVSFTCDFDKKFASPLKENQVLSKFLA